MKAMRFFRFNYNAKFMFEMEVSQFYMCLSHLYDQNDTQQKQNNVKKSNKENTKWTDKNVYEESRFYFNVSQRNNVVIITTA